MATGNDASKVRWFVATASVGALLLASAASAASLASADATAFLPPPVETPSAPVPVEAPETFAPTMARLCPNEMALVGDSCVDRWEASLVELHDDDSETAFSPYEAPNGRRVRAVSRAGVVPQAHVSMVEAKRACGASGKRLCRADEWKAACKGPSRTRYPYGDERVPGACVDTNRTSPMNTLHNGERTSRTMNDPRANQQDGTVEPTGATEACTNDYDVHDMVGNVHEWTDDGSFRGGYYLDTKLNGHGCDYRTTVHAPTYYDYSTGFRCCADAGSDLPDDEA